MRGLSPSIYSDETWTFPTVLPDPFILSVDIWKVVEYYKTLKGYRRVVVRPDTGRPPQRHARNLSFRSRRGNYGGPCLCTVRGTLVYGTLWNDPYTEDEEETTRKSESGGSRVTGVSTSQVQRLSIAGSRLGVVNEYSVVKRSKSLQIGFVWDECGERNISVSGGRFEVATGPR